MKDTIKSIMEELFDDLKNELKENFDIIVPLLVFFGLISCLLFV